MWAMYDVVQQATVKEIGRLELDVGILGISEKKVLAIRAALERLSNLLVQRYPESLKAKTWQYNSEKEFYDYGRLHLLTAESMLSAHVDFKDNYRKVPQKSLREALDISRNNPLNLFAELGTLWGVSTSVQNVENEIQQARIEN